jgi:hypothetical protein
MPEGKKRLSSLVRRILDEYDARLGKLDVNLPKAPPPIDEPSPPPPPREREAVEDPDWAPAEPAASRQEEVLPQEAPASRQEADSRPPEEPARGPVAKPAKETAPENSKGRKILFQPEPKQAGETSRSWPALLVKISIGVLLGLGLSRLISGDRERPLPEPAEPAVEAKAPSTPVESPAPTAPPAIEPPEQQTVSVPARPAATESPVRPRKEREPAKSEPAPAPAPVKVVSVPAVATPTPPPPPPPPPAPKPAAPAPSVAPAAPPKPAPSPDLRDSELPQYDDLTVKVRPTETKELDADLPGGLIVGGSEIIFIERDDHMLVSLNSSREPVRIDTPFPNLSPSSIAESIYGIWSVDSESRKIRLHRHDTMIVRQSFDAPGDMPHGLHWDGQHLWTTDVSKDAARRVYRHSFDTTRLAVLASFSVKEKNPIAVHRDRSMLWVLDGTTLRVGRYRIGSSLQYLGSADLGSLIPEGKRVTGFAADIDSVWVLTQNPSRLHRIDKRRLSF